MKILALHPKEWSLDPAQGKLGVEVRHVSIGGPAPKRLDGKISYDGIGEVATPDGLLELAKAMRDFRPDYLLFGIHFGLSREELEGLKKLSPDTRIVMHYTDQRNNLSKHVRQYRGLLDLILVTNKDGADFSRYRAFGFDCVKTFYDGVDVKVYRPKPVKPEFEVYFGGNDFYELEMELRRQNQQTFMLDKFTGAHFRHAFLEQVALRHRLVIHGQWGWDKSKFLVRPMLFCPREVDGMLEGKLIVSTFNLRLRGLITRKLLRSLASGRMVITEFCDGMEEHFENRRHLAWFHSMDEGLDLIRYYLDHEREREAIGLAGRKLIGQRHTFHDRLVDFIKIVREVFG